MTYVDALSELEEFDDGSKPWADFVFDLVSVEVKKPAFGSDIKSIELELRAAHESGDLGLKVKLAPSEWTVDTRNPDLLLSWGNATLMSAGVLSDRLIRLYESWWDLPTTSDSAVDLLTVQAVCIGGDVRDAQSKKIHLKLFFEPGRDWDGEGDDPAYGELFLNFDLSARRGWLLEKDTDYRSAVVRWLSGQLRGPSGEQAPSS